MPPATHNPYLTLMQKAAAHAREHGAKVPILSPKDSTVLSGEVPVAELQRLGIRVIPWTTNDPDTIRAVIGTGVDGLISDRPDLLRQAMAETRPKPGFDVEGHRGGRGLRPENTLPSFEAGMDQGIDTIEADTGVTSDRVSLIWHDQFLNPLSCRHADGSAYYTPVFIRDVSIADAQKTFLCDKLRFGTDQKNDLALSPVAVAFARQEKLISPYVPTYVEQLFRFTRFYAGYYRSGPGKTHPQAAQRAHTADTVRFNLETKILPTRPEGSTLPAELFDNHTVSAQGFVDTLCGAIVRSHMQDRSDVQSFDFRTLILVEEQFPAIQTVYLTEDSQLLSSEFLPPSLRVPDHKD